MPLFGGTFSHHSRGLHGGGTDSTPPSRPGSRAPSPTRLVTRNQSYSPNLPGGSSSNLPIRPSYNSTASASTITGSTAGTASTGTSYTGSSAVNGYGGAGAGSGTGTVTSGSGTGAASGTGIDSSDLDVEPPSPAYGPYTPFSDMTWASGANTPGGYFGSSSASSVYGPQQHHPVEIVLDADHLVMRGQGGDMNPAYLSGRLELELSESTNIREINMTLVGKAKVQFTDFSASSAKNHHFTHPVYHYDWSFLAGDKRHTHTLKAGHHSWPFQLALNGDLPSTIHTYNGEALIQYKMRATVVRSGFTHSNWQTQKMFYLQRTYTPDALEFNQTLEIENTWPGKIMYSLTLPYKAYAAGDDIPVNVKFMPLAKGVRVTAVNSVLKEYTMVHTRHSTHSDSRVAASCKHELSNGQAKLVQDDVMRPPGHSLGAWSGYTSRRGSVDPIRLASQASGSGDAGPSSSANRTDEEIARTESDIMIGDDEVNTAISIRVPAWTTPSHSIHPLFVTHKLKWSCTIANPDGHISELRCALPILILDHSLLDEARAAGASTRALLFGGGENQDVAQVDLPSYSNHVYDRVAADSGPATGYTSRSSRTPTGHHTPASNGTNTPPHSRPPSRPASPTRRGTMRMDDAGLNNPPRPELPSGTDTELLRALGALELHAQSPSPTHTPPESISRTSSRPLSRRSSHVLSGRSSIMGSRVGSRAGSRASSPERGHSHSHSASHSAGSASPNALSSEDRRPSFAGRLHLPSFKPLSSISKPILRNSSGVNLNGQGQAAGGGAEDAPIARNASFPALNTVGERLAGSGNHVSFHPSTSTTDGSTRRRGLNFHLGSSTPSDNGGGSGHASGTTSPVHQPADAQGWEAHRADPMLLTPSYEIAARGFASAMDSGPPTYDASNQEMERTRSQSELARAHRSDTALVNMGMDAEAAADAEMRAAGEDGQGQVPGPREGMPGQRRENGLDGEMFRQPAPGTPADEEGQITF